MAEIKATPEIIETPVEKPKEEVMTINLAFQHTTANVDSGFRDNDGNPIWETKVYGPGKVTAPVDIAEDLIRRDGEASESDRRRLIGTEQIMEIPGVIDAGGYDVTQL
jgi:hypothetical protein